MRKNDDMIKIAYDYISGLKSRSASFKKIWKKIIKVKNFDQNEQINNISLLHMQLTQNKKFMLSPKNGYWGLREDFKFSEYKRATTKSSKVFELLNLDDFEEVVSEEEEYRDFQNITDEDK